LDEAIYTEGTPGDAMYIVESGEVKLMDTAFSDAHLLERLRPGEAFGETLLEEAFVHGVNRAASGASAGISRVRG
jgi:CRP-like cAMP-binding protein